MRLFRRAERAPEPVLAAAGLERGEKVLAFAQDGERWLLGTRLALVLVTAGQDTRRVPWEEVQAADWDRDTGRLRVSEVGSFGVARAVHEFALQDPALLLQLIRERVSATVVLQRGRLVQGKKGLKVIGRRSPRTGQIAWMHEYDEGVDPEDPVVAAAAADLLAQARSDVGPEPSAPWG